MTCGKSYPRDDGGVSDSLYLNRTGPGFTSSVLKTQTTYRTLVRDTDELPYVGTKRRRVTMR